MADTTHGTGIEWTHVSGYKGETWNPVRGCTKISPGCKHCYAETFAERWRGVAGHPYEQGFDLRLLPEKLGAPLRAKAPRAYFVNSMSDLHQDGVPHTFLRAAYSVMVACRRHIFMVLTKRAEGMRAELDAIRRDRGPFESYEDFSGSFIQDKMRAFAEAPPPNVWLGVSVEDRKYGLPRVDILRTIPAAVRFLSVEPLLEDLGPLDLSGIHWVIVGGESGPGARPFDVGWAEAIVEQCKAQQVPVFLKQLGASPTGSFGDMPVKIRLKSKKGSDESEWPPHLRGLKQFPVRGTP
jgi:protein gp37